MKIALPITEQWAHGGKITRSFFSVMACSYASALGYLRIGLEQKASAALS